MGKWGYSFDINTLLTFNESNLYQMSNAYYFYIHSCTTTDLEMLVDILICVIEPILNEYRSFVARSMVT